MKSKKFDLRSLDYSPESNPLLEGTVISSKGRKVAAGMKRELLDPSTGELQAVSSIHRVKEMDDAEFVKVFSDGIKASFNLTKTAHRVFQAILDEYEKTPMSKGYADAIYLSWFNNGLCGRDIGMSEYTWKRGLKELLEKGFIYPRSPDMFWVNPALFFKGDRVLFIKEYHRKNTSNEKRDPNTIDAFNGKSDAE